jgi:hypothetical protein
MEPARAATRGILPLFGVFNVFELCVSPDEFRTLGQTPPTVGQMPFISSERLIPRVLAMTSILRSAKFRSPLSIPPM